MKLIFENCRLTQRSADSRFCVVTDGAWITDVRDMKEALPLQIREDARVIDCRGDLLLPAFANAHCHAAMTLFRGYGENLPLQRWLDERILPAEDKLTDEAVYWASMLAAAEMIRGGTVSFTDMYFFVEDTARAVLESGMKANLARSVVSFDPDEDPAGAYRVAESLQLFRDWNGAGDGRIRVDFSLHAEYTNVERTCRYLAEEAAACGARMQLHLSETKKEHEDCIRRHGMTPTEFFAACGVFDVPTTAAHAVWVSEDDLAILREKKVFVAHNPVSNLKLGSGMMPYEKMRASGICIALGTDGAASNNRLSVLRELQTAALLHKGTGLDPTAAEPSALLLCATRNGMLSQGREDSGMIEPGMRADLTLLRMDSLHNIPSYDPLYTLAFSADTSDVRMTVCDGVILYENGAYTAIDEEKLRFEMARVLAHYFD